MTTDCLYFYRSVVQSLFGMGVLVFGTPSLLRIEGELEPWRRLDGGPLKHFRR